MPKDKATWQVTHLYSELHQYPFYSAVFFVFVLEYRVVRRKGLARNL